MGIVSTKVIVYDRKGGTKIAERTKDSTNSVAESTLKLENGLTSIGLNPNATVPLDTQGSINYSYLD